MEYPLKKITIKELNNKLTFFNLNNPLLKVFDIFNL